MTTPRVGPEIERAARRLAADLGWVLEGIEPLAGDVSPRRYFRLRLFGGSTGVLAAYPSGDGGACARFAITSRLLSAAGVRVPAVLADDCRNGWMLLEDLGPSTLFDLRSAGWPRLLPFLREAARDAARIAALPAAEVARLSPRLDGPRLLAELRQTWEVFLVPRGLAGGATAARRLEAMLGTLCERLGAGPAKPCHRDFMARNLVPLEGGPAVGVLDHQDLRLGPAYYDLASLLNDSLLAPPSVEEELLVGAGVGEGDRAAYHRAAAQRGLKAVGTFAAFAARGHARHVPLIRPTFERALHHLARVPEAAVPARDLSAAWRLAAPPLPAP